MPRVADPDNRDNDCPTDLLQADPAAALLPCLKLAQIVREGAFLQGHVIGGAY